MNFKQDYEGIMRRANYINLSSRYLIQYFSPVSIVLQEANDVLCALLPLHRFSPERHVREPLRHHLRPTDLVHVVALEKL